MVAIENEVFESPLTMVANLFILLIYYALKTPYKRLLIICYSRWKIKRTYFFLKTNMKKLIWMRYESIFICTHSGLILPFVFSFLKHFSRCEFSHNFLLICGVFRKVSLTVFSSNFTSVFSMLSKIYFSWTDLLIKQYGWIKPL